MSDQSLHEAVEASDGVAVRVEVDYFGDGDGIYLDCTNVKSNRPDTAVLTPEEARQVGRALLDAAEAWES